MKHVSTFTWDKIFLAFNNDEDIIISDFSLEYTEKILKRFSEAETSSERKNLMMGISAMEKKSSELAKLIIDHGYDEMSASTDEENRNSIIRSLNRLSKKTALRLRESSYLKYMPTTICRCGSWYFIIEKCDFEEVSIEYNKEDVSNRGGDRKGAGRKRVYNKLRFTETDLLMVPKYEKEALRTMLIWMIDRQADGNGLARLLTTAVNLMEEKAEMIRYEEESVKLKEQASLLKDFRSIIPSFSIREECESEAARLERERINREWGQVANSSLSQDD